MGDPAGALELWRGNPADPGALDRCVAAYLPLVHRVWSGLKVGLPPSAEGLSDDLIQCGSLGLVAAIEHWDPGRGVPFEAWARLKIRGAMLDELRRQDILSKESRRRWKVLRRGMEELQQSLQRPCTEEEWAQHLGCGVEELRERLLENTPAAMVFLDGFDGEDGLPLAERLADPAAPQADEAVQKRELQEALAEAVGRLPERERNLLYLLLEEELGHKEAAQVLGVSPGRVSQIYAKAVLHLQAALAIKFGRSQGRAGSLIRASGEQ